MSTIKAIAMTICVCGITCSLLGIISPTKKTKKILNLVIGLFIICSIIIPIKSAINSFNINIADIDTVEEITNNVDDSYNEKVIWQTSENLEAALKALLNNNNYYPDKIKIHLETTNENSIYIKQIDIYMDKTDNTIDIKRLTKENFQVTPNIITE